MVSCVLLYLHFLSRKLLMESKNLLTAERQRENVTMGEAPKSLYPGEIFLGLPAIQKPFGVI